MCCWMSTRDGNDQFSSPPGGPPSAETWYHKNFMLSTSIIKSCCRHSRASCHAREPNVLLDC